MKSGSQRHAERSAHRAKARRRLCLRLHHSTHDHQPLWSASCAAVGGEETEDADAKQLDIPIHAFDLIVADECHRGY